VGRHEDGETGTSGGEGDREVRGEGGLDALEEGLGVVEQRGNAELSKLLDHGEACGTDCDVLVSAALEGERDDLGPGLGHVGRVLGLCVLEETSSKDSHSVNDLVTDISVLFSGEEAIKNRLHLGLNLRRDRVPNLLAGENLLTKNNCTECADLEVSILVEKSNKAQEVHIRVILHGIVGLLCLTTNVIIRT
jgi:hypothetical protein